VVYLLDTNAFSDLMREHPNVQARLAALSPTEELILCTIVRGEILHGLTRLPEGRRRQELAGKAHLLFNAIPCAPIIESAAVDYAEIKLRRQQKGLTLDGNDLWIAANARQSGATLVSRDTDFKNVDGLQVEDWTK